jgi:hypothetical protein
VLRSHTLRLKNDRDVSLQTLQKKRAPDGAPAQRATQLTVSLAGLNRRPNELSFAPGCSQRRDTAMQHFGAVNARTVLVGEGLEQVN